MARFPLLVIPKVLGPRSIFKQMANNMFSVRLYDLNAYLVHDRSYILA